MNHQWVSTLIPWLICLSVCSSASAKESTDKRDTPTILLSENGLKTVAEEEQTASLMANLNTAVDNRNAEHPSFNDALSSEKIPRLLAALNGLGRIGGKQIIARVVPFLAHAEPKIRKAAAFALGLSKASEASPYLWDALNKEKVETVKQEIYLAFAGVGHGADLSPSDFLIKLTNQIPLETSIETKQSVFQALSMMMVFKSELASELSGLTKSKDIDIRAWLKLFAKDDQLSYSVGFLLGRIPKIDTIIRTPQLQPFLSKVTSLENKKMLAKLISKVVTGNHLSNRRILSWLIEQSNQADIGLVCESIRSMSQFTNIAQAKIQLGKLQASANPLISQTALSTLAASPLEGREIMTLFKQQLKSDNSGIVVEAMNGLIQRQQRDDMTWALKIMNHPSRYVKVKFIQLIVEKDKPAFLNVIRRLAQDKDAVVSAYAKSVVEGRAEPSSTLNKSHAFKIAAQSHGQSVLLKTTAGDIVITMNSQATFTTDNFLRLVSNDFYNNSFFSRVIGNFVAQGGDPIGNGEGASLLSIREEISYLPHSIGSVGMATAGKDTGDSQFFINTGRNLHLDRNYTIFAKVTEGLENVYRLSQGDQIISASIIKPNAPKLSKD
jgi:cyclophilin family peptidyl-prolyl cis-trans isomerase